MLGHSDISAKDAAGLGDKGITHGMLDELVHMSRDVKKMTTRKFEITCDSPCSPPHLTKKSQTSVRHQDYVKIKHM